MANVEKEEWIGHFVELQIKDLSGEPLTEADRCFLVGIELAGRSLPGALEDALLRYGLSTARASAPPVYRIAAATDESSIYKEVQQAIAEGQTTVMRESAAGPVKVLQIHAAENLVEPLYREGYTFIIERKSFERQTAGKYGGVFIAIGDLQRMELEYDPTAKTMRLFEK